MSLFVDHQFIDPSFQIWIFFLSIICFLAEDRNSLFNALVWHGYNLLLYYNQRIASTLLPIQYWHEYYFNWYGRMYLCRVIWYSWHISLYFDLWMCNCFDHAAISYCCEASIYFAVIILMLIIFLSRKIKCGCWKVALTKNNCWSATIDTSDSAVCSVGLR